VAPKTSAIMHSGVQFAIPIRPPGPGAGASAQLTHHDIELARGRDRPRRSRSGSALQASPFARGWAGRIPTTELIVFGRRITHRAELLCDFRFLCSGMPLASHELDIDQRTAARPGAERGHRRSAQRSH
jgi:hypothetical protein